MTSSASADEIGAPAARIARSVATTVGSIGSEWTVISSRLQAAAIRSSVPRRSNALFSPRPRSTPISASVRWPR